MSTRVKILRWVAAIIAFLAAHLYAYRSIMVCPHDFRNHFLFRILTTINANMIAPTFIAALIAPSHKKAVANILCAFYQFSAQQKR